MKTATLNKPVFVKDNTRWARVKYSMYKDMGYTPSPSHPDYGLYKYGEYLINNGL